MQPQMEPKDFSLENIQQLSPEGISGTKKRRKKAMEMTEADIEKQKSAVAKEKRTKKIMEMTEADIEKRKGEARDKNVKKELEQFPHLKTKFSQEREEEIKETLKELAPDTKEQDADVEFDFSDIDEEPKETKTVLKELRKEEAKKIREQEKNGKSKKPKEKKSEAMEAATEFLAADKEKVKEEAEWAEAIKTSKIRAEKEEIIKLKKSIKESAEQEEASEKKYEIKGGAEMKKHLRANLLDYPELLQPEIKKNLQIIAKNENVIEKNKGNAKKSAQEKIKKAEEVIERAQEAVDSYADDLVKQYNTSHNLLMEKSRELYGEQKPGKKQATGGLEQKIITLGGGAGLEKGGLFGIKGVFRDRKLKKQLGDKWDEFEILRDEYHDKEKFYNERLASHTKRFGRLEETLETGTAFSIAHRGGGEKLPGVRGK